MWLPKAPRLHGCSELDKLLTQLGNFQPKRKIQVRLRCPSCRWQCPAVRHRIPDLRMNAGVGWRDATGVECRTAGQGNAPALCWFVLDVGRTTTRFAFRKERIRLCCSASGGGKETSVIYTYHEVIRYLCLILIPQIFLTSKNNCKNTKNKWETDCNKQSVFIEKTPNPKPLLCTGTKNRNVKLKPK